MRPDEFLKLLRLSYYSDSFIANEFVLELGFWVVVLVVTLVLLRTQPSYFRKIETEPAASRAAKQAQRINSGHCQS
jgi:hypothetical protein